MNARQPCKAYGTSVRRMERAWKESRLARLAGWLGHVGCMWRASPAAGTWD